MTIYSVVLFLHVTAALGLGAALGIEWTGTLRLRAAATPAEARGWAGALRPLRMIGMPSLLVLLLSGGYMTATTWGPRPWISTALLALVLLGILGGGVTGRRMRALGAALRPERDRFDAATRRRLLDPALLVSLYLRSTTLAAIILLMTVRPGWIGSAAVLAGAIVLGLGVGVRSSTRGRILLEGGPAG
jgi:hypothetical protein